VFKRFNDFAFQNFYVSLEEQKYLIHEKVKNVAAIFSDKSSRGVRINKLQQQTKEILKAAFENPEQITAEGIENLVLLNQEVVSQIAKNPNAYHDLISNLSKSGTDYGHALNCQSLALLFGMGLGYSHDKALTDLALAGLLHDVGLALTSKACRNTPYAQMSDEIKAEYHTHTLKSVEWINKMKPNLVSREALLMIEQHHELANGTGFPHGIRSVNLYPLSKMLAIVDEVETQLSLRQYENPAADLMQILAEMNFKNMAENEPKFDRRYLTDMLKFLQNCFARERKSA